MRCLFWNSLRPSDRAGKAAPRPHAQRLTRAFEAELQWVRKQGLPRIAHGRRASCRERSPGEGGAGLGLTLWWFSTRPRPSDPKLRHRKGQAQEDKDTKESKTVSPTTWSSMLTLVPGPRVGRLSSSIAIQARQLQALLLLAVAAGRVPRRYARRRKELDPRFGPSRALTARSTARDSGRP